MRTLKKLLQHKEVCHPMLAIFLLLTLLLRIPNFFEPYWYGDEAIYLTIGNGIRTGQQLYVDIVDHKTPLIYYFASVGSQLNFRILLVTWMLITTIAFYRFSERIFKNKWSTYLATLFFITFTTLPLFEGNIPNGELFVMGFVIFGFWILSYSSFFEKLLAAETSFSLRKTAGAVVVSGVLFGLGVLTKVPGILDVAAALSIGWFTLLHHLKLTSLGTVHTTLKKHFPRILVPLILFSAGVALPIIFSVLYYVLRGSGEAYLNFGLLYNFHYTGNWDLGFTNPILSFLFTMPGKVLILGTSVLLFSSLSKYLSAQFQFVATWVVAAIFASLLSNRPYPHYFLQIVPPLALLLGFSLEKVKPISKYLTVGITAALLLLILGTFKVMHVGGYPTVSYYDRSIKMLAGTTSYIEYRNSFNDINTDNYTAAEVISKSSDPYMFIWGTNPSLYALTKKQPTGRFTVSFHIIDLKVYDETFKSILNKKPEYIVVMNNETAELPGLQIYLRQNYIANNSFDHFVLWRKRSASSL